MITSKQARIRVFTHFLQELAGLSKCTDKKIAAIIINEQADQVLSIGVNGGPKGGMDCLCQLGGKYTCVHAEANALAKCHVACSGKIMQCTMSPCITCATLIVNSGISGFYYINDYKDSTGLSILSFAGVDIRKLEV
jgi:dCMP deaminase